MLVPPCELTLEPMRGFDRPTRSRPAVGTYLSLAAEPAPQLIVAHARALLRVEPENGAPSRRLGTLGRFRDELERLRLFVQVGLDDPLDERGRRDARRLFSAQEIGADQGV